MKNKTVNLCLGGLNSLQAVDAAPAISAVFNYSCDVLDFIKELLPDFSSWDLLVDLKGVVSPTLNLMFELAVSFYKMMKKNGGDLLKILISVMNFYFRTQEYKSWTSLVVGFVDLLNSIFAFSKDTKILSLVTKTVKTYFTKIKESLLRPEAAEKTVESFWKLLEFKNDRSFLNIIWNLSSVFVTVSYVGEFFTNLGNAESLEKIIEIVNKHLIQKSSDLRTSVKSASLYIAQIYDFIIYNQEHLLTGNFSKISWSLPLAVRVENEFADYMALYRRVVTDSSVLVEQNMTWIQLRSQGLKIRGKMDEQIRASEKGSLHSAYVRYLKDIDSSLDYIQHRIDPDNTKVEPLSVFFYGTPGCGKSQFAEICGKLMQKAAGRETNSSLHVTAGGDPKFAVGINNDTEVIVFDDFANDTSRKISPKEILDAVNITREPIPKAGVDEKNKHRFSNIGTIFTSNNDNLGMPNIATVSKDSILRRFGFGVRVGIKEEYCRPGTKNLDKHHPDVAKGFNPEVYELQVENLMYVDDKGDVVKAPVEDWKLFPEENDYRNLIYYLQQRFASTWNRNVKSHQRSLAKEDRCTICDLDSFSCVCNLNPSEATHTCLKAESLMDKVDTLTASFRNFKTSSVETLLFWDHSLMDCVHAFGSAVMWRMFLLKIYSLFGGLLLDLYSNRNMYFLLFAAQAVLWVVNPTLFGIFGNLVFLLRCPGKTFWHYIIAFVCFCLCVATEYLPFSDKIILNCTVFWILIGVYGYSRVMELRRSLSESYMTTHRFVREHHRVRWAGYLAVCGMTTLSLLGIVSLFASKYLRPEKMRDPAKIVKSTDDLDPYAPEAPKTNDNSKARYWFLPKPGPKAVTVSTSDAQRFLGKHCVVVEVTSSDGSTVQVRGIPMGSELLIPFHSLPTSGLFDIKVCADSSKRTSASYMKDVPLSHTQRLKDIKGKFVDLVLVNYTGMASQQDMTRFFSETNQLPMQGAGRQLKKSPDGTFSWIPVQIKTHRGTVCYEEEGGEKYTANHTYDVTSRDVTSDFGECGSPLLAEDTNCIVGLHIAGDQTTTWIVQKITKSMIDEARHELSQKRFVFVSHPVPEAFLLKDNLTDLTFEPVVSDHAVETIGMQSSPIHEIGHLHKGGRLYVDKATKHYFPNNNPGLVEIFGEPNSRPPVEPNGKKQINSTLKKLADPTFDCPIALMERAAQDYLDGESNGVSFNTIISDLKTEYGEDFFKVRTVEEAARGDGTGIVRGLNNGSSAGMVYGGSKKAHMDFDVGGDPLEVRKFLPYIQEAVSHQETEWRNGRGTFDPFKRCSKVNELLPWEKAGEKTRSFYGNDVVFNLNATRAFIPAKHLLRRDMEHSECFVGIVPQSKQWEDLQTFITRNGAYDRFVCGDFSGYDTQLPKSLLDMASNILLELLKRGGMSRDDLEFARGALSSVVSPTLIWEGHVLRMANGQPSGQPLTVELNSIMNSLLMRMAFYSIADKEDSRFSGTNFREFVRLATYGDDNLLGVSAQTPFFNHTRIQSEFALWSIKYTMADKEADSVPYQTLNEVSFLKRSFYEHPVLGIVAPIEKESIIKKFYYWVRLSNTPLSFPEQFVDNFNSSARDAYLHGEEYYSWFCKSIERLRETSMQQSKEFQVEWHRLVVPSVEEMREALKPSYGL